MELMNNFILLFFILHGWGVEQSQGFNVGTAGAKVFSGSPAEEFGYTVQQLSNTQGKWLLVGSPWRGYTQNRTGDVYKCGLKGSGSTCDKLDLQNSVSIPAVQNINVNMSLGMTLTRTPKNNGFMTCGPLWAQGCGTQNFYPGVCVDVDPLFSPQPAISPALQTCGGPMDIAIVLDGSNSIYPWAPVVNFLVKLLENLDIGPQQSQVSVIQYGNDPKIEFYMNTYKTKAQMVTAAKGITQKGGSMTNTFGAIDFVRKNAYLTLNGARPGASKVMVVVTDGESHDNTLMKKVIGDCDTNKINRFGIAVLGYYTRNNIDTKKLVEEIKSIASIPTEKFYFNVSDEVALSEIAGTLGERIFNIEGTGKGGEFQMEMSQVGFSAHQTKNKDVLMLGAVGAYGWSGTVVHRNAQKFDIFPKQAFEAILEDKNHSSLLGYSVTTLTDGSSEFFVAGAPRSNHTGQVVVYILNSQRQPEIKDSQRGEQIGSYFGGVLCSLDVDRDGVTDLLLVGAPMYMSEHKTEMGKVYIFSSTNGILNKQESLEGPTSLENARFGMAIVAVPDLNQDGFSDVVVGAPLEENNKGAIYIYNGDRKNIRKQSSQRIPGTKVDPGLKFFGRSLDSSGDMNGDSVPDVSVGGYGKVVQLWSSGVAVVTAKMTFTPDRINILTKPYGFSARVCFSATFKPSKLVGPAAIRYNLTLDADLQSSRVTSRGLFSNSERVVQRDIGVSTQDTCEDHKVNVQETPDLFSSIAVRVDIKLQHPDSNPVLDVFSTTAWEFFIPFSKDCGNDDTCYSDLVLTAMSDKASGSTLLVSHDKKRLSFDVSVMNRKENAYNTRVFIRYSDNLSYTSFTPPKDGTEVKCTAVKDKPEVSCQVGYPALKTDQLVKFDVQFEFNIFNSEPQSSDRLQKDATVDFEAQSDSKEETPADNKETRTFSVQYSSDIILSREAKMDVYLLEKDKDTVTAVKTYSDIGPEFKFSLQVTGGSFPVSLIYLDVSLPSVTKAGNPLLYISSVTPVPESSVQCDSIALIDPLRIAEKEYTASFAKESFRGTKELNCKTATCKHMKCLLKDLNRNSVYYVNVTAWIWNGTFEKADFQSVALAVGAEIKTSHPDLILITHKQVQIDVTVSKPGAKSDVPIGVIVGSVIAGLLLLALAVAGLWKAGFFKRQYQQLQRNENPAETEGLQDGAGQA